MVLENNSKQPSVGVQKDFVVNPLKYRKDYSSSFMYNPEAQDSNVGLAKYLNERSISEMIQVNSEIKQICKKLNVPAKVNLNILDNLVKNHLPQTKKIALGIVNHLPHGMRTSVNVQSLQKAAVLHDIGKALIPDDVVNKPGALDEQEREVMKAHSTLGYELLKNSDLDKETLYLLRHHHQNAQKTGYPCVESNFVADINLQILSVADVYSALREKRSYKKELNKNQALAIIHKDMKQGKVHPYVFKALVDFANKEEESTSTKIKSNKQVFYLKPEYSLSA